MHDILDSIKRNAIAVLRVRYGWCSTIETDSEVIINTLDKGGKDIKITIKFEYE